MRVTPSPASHPLQRARWGLVGGTLMLATGLLRMFDPSLIYLALPILLYEMVLAVWLIVKGFNSSAIASESVKTDMNEEK